MRSSKFRPQPLWLRTGGAVLLSFAVFGASLALGLPQHGARFLLLFPTVLVCAYFAGRDSGVAATIAGGVAVALYMALEPGEPSDMSIAIGSLLLFMFAGIGSSVVLSELKRALRSLEEKNEELKHAHAAAVTAEEQSDLLLRELRHRVRNDLSNVIAILRLQSKRLEGPSAAHVNAAADRLQVLAKLHEKLSRQGSSPIVEMKGFLHDLCGDYRSTTLALRPLALVTELDSLELPSSRALPAGLILNELLTNAVKYAYPGEQAGTITVVFSVGEQEAELRVEDDGCGIEVAAAERTDSNGSGLGHRLVRSLTAQLRGTFQCSSNTEGTACRVCFPVNV